MAPSRSFQGRVNKVASRLIPLLLVGIGGYATWVVVVLIGVIYLIRSHPGVPARTGAGAAIITLFFVFLVPAAAAFFRTFLVVLRQPGYVPYSNSTNHSASHHRGKKTRHVLRRKSRAPEEQVEKPHPTDIHGSEPNEDHTPSYLDRGAVLNGTIPPPDGLEDYYSRNIFECEIDGLPRYCTVCKTWKPDRAHHSSEGGRCLYKFDHYCPWAGGTVAEPSFKFFVQFCAYSAVLCAYILVVSAYFVAERGSKFGTYDVNWIVITALAALFFMFTAGMSYNTLHAISLNSTTIDKLSRRSRIHYLAVWIPTAETNLTEHSSEPAGSTTSYSTITYPLPGTSSSDRQSSARRRFAILASPVGSSPYQLSSFMENFKSVMGRHFVDWVLPLHKSPCCSHLYRSDRFGQLMYPLGPVIDQMLMDAALMPRPQGRTPSGRPSDSREQRSRSRRPAPRTRESNSEHTQQALAPQAPSDSQVRMPVQAPRHIYVPTAFQREPNEAVPEPDLQGSVTMSRLYGGNSVS